MLLERMIVREKKRVVLFAPKAANEDVWGPAIETYLDDSRLVVSNVGSLSTIPIFNVPSPDYLQQA